MARVKPGSAATAPAAEPATGYADRVVKLERIDPDLIDPHPHNPRVHTDSQRQVVRKLLERFGIVDAVIVRKKKGGRYELINGHLRRDEIRQPTPALVIDATAEEAAKLLSQYDAVARIADVNADALRKLVDATGAIDAALKPLFDMHSAVLDALERATPADDGPAGDPGDEEPEPDRDQGDDEEPDAAPAADTKLVNLYYTAEQHEAFLKVVEQYRKAKGGEIVPIPLVVLDVVREMAA